MTDKEVARFKVKFPKINLSKARLDGIKLNLADDADEATIDAKLDEVNGYMSYEEMAKEDDRLRQPPKPTPPPTPAPGNPPAPAPPAPGDDTPAWAKTLIEQNKTLSEKVAALETGKTTDSRKTKLETALKDTTDAYKNTIMKAFNRMGNLSDEDFESYLGEVTTDAAEFVQTEANAGLGGMGKPQKAGGGGDTKKASKEEVQAIFGKSKP